MDIKTFGAYHLPALLREEVKFSRMISLVEGAACGDLRESRRWSFGRPGACAMQRPGYPIHLADLNKEEIEQLADEVAGTHFVGVAGPDERPHWFASCAKTRGARFNEPTPLRILALSSAPIFPGAPGEARAVMADDGDLLAAWFEGFRLEAVPEDPPFLREMSDRRAASGDYMIWVVDGRPVSLAGIVRRTANTASIAAVYTPPDLRDRGYAGSVTAAVVEKIHAEGRTTACLDVDLRNPASNRCYAKIGFEPVCESWIYRWGD